MTFETAIPAADAAPVVGSAAVPGWFRAVRAAGTALTFVALVGVFTVAPMIGLGWLDVEPSGGQRFAFQGWVLLVPFAMAGVAMAWAMEKRPVVARAWLTAPGIVAALWCVAAALVFLD